MGHHISDYRGLGGEAVRVLPDGRRLVQGADLSVRVIDHDGGEMIPSASEIAALFVVAEMTLPRRRANGKRLFRPQCEEDWKLAV